jgi:hypothetical protein
MIKNTSVWNDIEREQMRMRTVDYASNLRIFESLWKEAIALRALPLSDPLAGIETDIQMAKILNSCSKTS